MLHPDSVNSVGAFAYGYFRQCFLCWLSESCGGWTCLYKDQGKMQVSTDMKQGGWRFCLCRFSLVCGAQHWKRRGSTETGGSLSNRKELGTSMPGDPRGAGLHSSASSRRAGIVRGALLPGLCQWSHWQLWCHRGSMHDCKLCSDPYL